MTINLFNKRKNNPGKNKLSGILDIHRFNIFKKLVPKEEISALEINDGSMRLLYLSYSDNKIKIISGNEIEIKPDIIAKGKVTSPDKLAEAIKELLKNAGPNPITSPYIILSVPEINNYTFTLDLPLIAKETINETIADNVINLLPQSINNYYIDWQELTKAKTEFNKFKIMISAAEKTTIDGYRLAIEKAGLNLIALETPSIGINRAIKTSENANFIIIAKPDGLIETICEQNELVFSRFATWLEILQEEKTIIENLPDESIFEKKLEEEIGKMINFYGSAPNKNIKNLTISICGEKYDFNNIAQKLSQKMNLNITAAATIFENLKNEFPFSDQSWQTSIGTALRTLIPREEDIIISLLPIGTEEIYTRQKLQSFLTALNKFTFFSAIFSIIALLGFLIYFNFELYNANKKLSATSHINLSPEILSLENQAENFNKNVKNIIEIESQIKNPAAKLNDLMNLMTVGITLNKVMITNDAKPLINISGNAATLEALMSLKQNLSQSSKFNEIKIPISALTKKENIDFNISAAYIQTQ